MRKVLVIGGTGFVGQHLAAALHDECRVVATGHNVDIRDLDRLCELVNREKPDRVVNLAGITTLRESIQNPRDTYDITFLGTFNLLTALKKSGFTGRMLFVSSSEVYGRPDVHDLPLKESQPLRPMTPYAVSKIAAEFLCYQWSQIERFEIVLARPFNHIGPGQSERFAISGFGRQVAAIKLGLAKPIVNFGDIDTTRDFTDVRDIVSAYQLLLERGKSGEIYNVCSGAEYSVRSIIEKLCNLSGVAVELQHDQSRLRLNELRRVCGSNEKLVADTGWKLRMPIDQTLTDILDWWIQKLHSINDI